MTVAEAWCVAAPGAKLALGVPTYTGQHGAMWANVHRIYGSKNLPFLVSQLSRANDYYDHCQMTNWRYEWSAENYSLHPNNDLTEYRYQPLKIFSKIN